MIVTIQYIVTLKILKNNMKGVTHHHKNTNVCTQMQTNLKITGMLHLESNPSDVDHLN